jgi:RNA polymerase sigma-70 factor (ECF subfamily)
MEQVLTDEELTKRVQEGHEEAFTLLFDRYEKKIIRYGQKFLYNYEDVLDAVQETFIKSYRNIESFDATRKFSTWLYRIAHNTFINVIKKKGRESVSFFDFDTFFQFAIPDPTSVKEDLLTSEDKTALNECLTTLDPKYREPLVLYYFEEKAYQEIADIMHIPTATVGVRLKRARDILKKKFLHYKK